MASADAGKRMAAARYHGWAIVRACLLSSMMGNALGLFGAGVYLHTATALRGWGISALSGAVTLFLLLSALLLLPVGITIGRHGPRPVFALGGAATALGVVGIGHATTVAQAYGAFAVLGIGWACLSTTAVATTLAPWFERAHGRAMATASIGASIGGMLGPPALLAGIALLGFGPATLIAGALALAVVLPLAGFVLRHRPEDIGQSVDGEPPRARRPAPPCPALHWRQAMRTASLRSVMAGFGIAMLVQIGFLGHQVSILAGSLGLSGVSVLAMATAFAALLGRLVLTRIADRIALRRVAAGVLVLAALGFGMMGSGEGAARLIAGSLMVGLTVGCVTTLAPIIIRAEFGAPGFGAIFGVASCGIQLMAAQGPVIWGLLHDLADGYGPALGVAACLDLAAAALILTAGGRSIMAGPRVPVR